MKKTSKKKAAKKVASKKKVESKESEKKAAKKVAPKMAMPPKKSEKRDMVKVKGLLYAVTKDGDYIEAGKECLISKEEAQRLEQNKKKQFFERL